MGRLNCTATDVDTSFRVSGMDWRSGEFFKELLLKPAFVANDAWYNSWTASDVDDWQVLNNASARQQDGTFVIDEGDEIANSDNICHIDDYLSWHTADETFRRSDGQVIRYDNADWGDDESEQAFIINTLKAHNVQNMHGITAYFAGGLDNFMRAGRESSDENVQKLMTAMRAEIQTRHANAVVDNYERGVLNLFGVIAPTDNEQLIESAYAFLGERTGEVEFAKLCHAIAVFNAAYTAGHEVNARSTQARKNAAVAAADALLKRLKEDFQINPQRMDERQQGIYAMLQWAVKELTAYLKPLRNPCTDNTILSGSECIDCTDESVGGRGMAANADHTACVDTAESCHIKREEYNASTKQCVPCGSGEYYNRRAQECRQRGGGGSTGGNTGGNTGGSTGASCGTQPSRPTPGVWMGMSQAQRDAFLQKVKAWKRCNAQ